MRHALFTILIFFASQAHGQVYRLYCVGNSACYGSAVCVSQQQDGSYLFVTAKHVVDSSNRFFLDLPNGRTEATLIVKSSKYDLAALRAKSNLELPLYPIAPTKQTSGRYVAVGYALGGKVRSTPMTIREGDFTLTAMNGSRQLRIPIQIETGVRAMQGESGGAIVSTDGKLVGVISCTDARHSYASGYAAMCELFGGIGYRVCPPQSIKNYGRPTAPIPNPYQSEQPPYVPEEQPVPEPTPEPRIEYRYIKGERGPAGPQGPPGESWNREIVRGWVREEVQEAISQVPTVVGPPGPPGEKGPRGPAGESYDPAELNELRQRVESLESKQTIILPTKEPQPRKITIYVQEIGPDGKPTGRVVATPVEVPPNENDVTIPIKRFNSGN